VITQNVDGLHHAAGSREVVELHGALRRVICLACGALESRDHVQQRLIEANPEWLAYAQSSPVAPDGDAELGDLRADQLLESFVVVACGTCGGVVMPDVVFFGGSVPRPTLDDAWATFARAEVLLVVGSSLTVFSGYRFVRRAAEHGIPVAIVNRGPTRGDPHAALRVDARAGETLTALWAALVGPKGSSMVATRLGSDLE
ncbi:MAG: Sir2 family NAD-dependent protein deacetylase, partial [Kofleriaceae bacterium]